MNSSKEARESRKPFIIKGTDSFVDDRGRIDNFYLPEAVNWIGLIYSKNRGLVRANHYHPEQLQQVLVTKGGYISVWKDLGDDTDAAVKHHLVVAGDLEIMPQNVAHAMVFFGETELLNLVNGERKHENFGTHTVPHVVVSPEDVENYLACYPDAK